MPIVAVVYDNPSVTTEYVWPDGWPIPRPKEFLRIAEGEFVVRSVEFDMRQNATMAERHIVLRCTRLPPLPPE